MERKLGIFAECLRGVKGTDALPLIKKAGFNSFETGRFRRESVKEIIEVGNDLGLICDAIHAPFIFDDAYCNDMWKGGEKYLKMYNSYMETIDSASEFGIPHIVIHFMGNLKTPLICDEGLKRFDEVVAYAQEKGVIIAFENLIRVGALAIAADRYEGNPNVGFCYDFGHAHCYSGYAYAKDLDWVDILQDRIVTTHIHDNEGFIEGFKGELDFHRIPFDGNLDYKKVMKKMDKYGYRGALILEVSNGRHLDMPHDEFLSMCYERLKRISDYSELEFND